MDSDISRGQDDDGHRWYKTDDFTAMSVTTVLDFLEEDLTGLEYWKRANNGQGDNAWHQHLFWYSGPRGTLCHYQVLNEFADEELWGKEERESLDQMIAGQPLDQELIENWHNERVPVDEDEIIYSVLNRKEVVETREQYQASFIESEKEHNLLDICYNDVEWFNNQFNDVADELGITQDSIISIERFLLDNDLGYGGQCDLVYENPDGETVLADLKTGSFLQKHRLQAVAYSKAVERADDIQVSDVDRLEVITIHPDKKHTIVHSHSEPDYISETGVEYETDDWFVDPYGNWEYESLDEMWETFELLVAEAHDEVNKE